MERRCMMNLQVLGEYLPKLRKDGDKIAVVVPVRNRDRHLNIFLQYMHIFLQNQGNQYKIYVIEQVQYCVIYISKEIY